MKNVPLTVNELGSPDATLTKAMRARETAPSAAPATTAAATPAPSLTSTPLPFPDRMAAGRYRCRVASGVRNDVGAAPAGRRRRPEDGRISTRRGTPARRT